VIRDNCVTVIRSSRDGIVTVKAYVYYLYNFNVYELNFLQQVTQTSTDCHNNVTLGLGRIHEFLELNLYNRNHKVYKYSPVVHFTFYGKF